MVAVARGPKGQNGQTHALDYDDPPGRQSHLAHDYSTCVPTSNAALSRGKLSPSSPKIWRKTAKLW